MASKYLIFNTKEEGFTRADVEGARRGYAYHVGGSGACRYHTGPRLTTDGKYALDVTEYELTDEEDATTVSNVTFPNPFQ